MKSTSLRANALACALLAGTAFCGLAAAPAAAQSSPTYRNLDPNGVDLVRGDFLTSFAEGSIGSGEAELALLRMLGATGSNGTQGSSQWDHILFNITSSGTYVDFGSRNDKFPGAESRGASLAGSGNSYQYRSPDGTVIAFTDPTPGLGDVTNFCDGTTKPSCLLLPTTITSPDGKVVNVNYGFWSLCVTTGGGGGPPYHFPDPNDPETATDCTYTPRIASVTNSYGYEIRFAYASAGGTSSSSNPPSTFHRRTGASFYNLNASSSALASVSYSYPSTGVVDITDQGGRVWQVTSASSNYAIRRPGASSNTTSASLTSGVVTSVIKEGITTGYSRSVSGSTATMVVTNALNQATTIVSSLTSGRPTSVTDPLGHTTGFTYDGSDRLKRTTAPEGNYVEHTYDARGNITQTVTVPKSGSGPTIVTSASYDSTCANPVTCNRPNSTTDSRGNVTDYTYDPTHGGVLTVTAPEPTPGAVRPQTRYSYTLTNGEYQLTGVSQCRTAASCTGTADEVKTALAYDSNGNLYWTATGDGTGTLVAATTMGFDALGNLLTVDGPLPGTADTSRTRYNAAHQVIGSVSPDPDGAGALRHRAVRNIYDGSTGLLTRVEQGNVDSQSDTDWAAFSPALAVETLYDVNARPVVSKLVSGSTVHALSQTGYDALGRPECSAQRMNPALFGSTLPAACSLGTPGTGANDYGPDRIAKTFYDPAGRAYRTTTALGTADEANEAILTFTDNGQVHTVTDGENNKTTYQYDGHDRPTRTYFPLPSPRGSGSSNGSDYEELTYESLAGGTRTSPLVTAFRNRAAQTIAYGYDALGRVVLKDVPGTEPDVAYAYDLLGRMTSASTSTQAVSLTYDALGRVLSEAQPHGTVTSAWDVAGRRTRLTYPDGYHVDYDHLVTGETTRIRENGATSGDGVLATFVYDVLGRRSSLVRGNGAVTNYGYDSASRLASLSHDFAGTAYDLTLAFGYNPAGQIAAATRSNDLYSWTGHGSGTAASTSNGLNQVTQAGAAAIDYDARGNILSDGGQNYSYSSENRLTHVVNPTYNAGINYDPLGRYNGYSPTTLTSRQNVSDGEQLVYLKKDNAFLSRTVFGPGIDEPLYHIDNLGRRTWLAADERGSIIAAIPADGAVSWTSRYDEYGNYASKAFEFGFAGSYWHTPAVGLFYMRARWYHPKLGRFLQTDPIGFGGGMNIYAYVKGDPVNFTDPSGLTKEEKIACTGTRRTNGCGGGGISSGLSGFSSAWPGGQAPTGEASLIALGVNTNGMSNSEMRALAGEFLGIGEQALASGFSRNAVVVWEIGPDGFSSQIFDAGMYNGNRTFGDNPSFSNRPNRHFPSGRITSGGQGGYYGALGDLDSLAKLNNLTSPSGVNIFTLPPKGWVPSFNPVSGYQILTNISTGLTFRADGMRNMVVIDIPPGLKIGTGAFDVSAFWESVHYR